jgi:S-adenosylhomocysteine hydrolase
MIREQIYVCPSSNQFNSDLSFDEQFIISVKNFLHQQLERMSLNKDDTLIILDDGGELISAAQTFKSYFPNIYGVEQTSSGYHKLAYTQMSFPVKNVAFSKAKLNFETPYIATSVVNNLEKKIALSEQEPKKILVVGYGCVGKEMLFKKKQK